MQMPLLLAETIRNMEYATTPHGDLLMKKELIA